MLLHDHLGRRTIDAQYVISWHKTDLDLPSGKVYRVSARVVGHDRSIILLEGVTEPCADALIAKIEDYKKQKDID